MNGFIKRVAASLALCGALACLSGCLTLQQMYHKCADPCYPERYNAMARDSVNTAFANQVGNGHVLDQTIWTYHFIHGTDKLKPSGLEELNRLTRRRPNPDPHIYLQTAHDVTFEPTEPDKLVKSRNKLDSDRVVAIQKYLSASTAGRGLSFEVTIHDPPVPGGDPRAVQAAQAQYYGAFGAGFQIQVGKSEAPPRTLNENQNQNIKEKRENLELKAPE